MTRLLCFGLVAASLSGCTAPGPLPIESSEPEVEAPPVVPLPVERQLLRASMTLVGRRPSESELAAVLADPAALEGVVDGYLASDAFLTTVRDMHDEWWLFEASGGSLPSNVTTDAARMLRELPLQPLKLIETVVATDESYDQILLADYTMVNDLVVQTWVGLDGVEAPPPGEWRRAQWTDGRPAAGILADSWLYVVYRSPDGNHNRGRANAVARTLLCLDFLEALPIPDASLDLADHEQVTNAIRNDPGCVSCHETLDPLASYFAMTPYHVVGESAWPLAMYSPAYETMWEDWDGLPPAYFGKQGEGLRFLAESIADDPKFKQCTARRAISYLEQRKLDTIPTGRVLDVAEGFDASGLSFKALVKSIVLDPAFADASEAGPAPQLLRPEQMGTLFEDLVGFTWTNNSDVICCGNSLGDKEYGMVTDVTRDGFIGVRQMLGGVDGPSIKQPNHTPTSVYLGVYRTLARLAAIQEMANLANGEPLLLTALGDDRADPAVVRAQLVQLHRRLFVELLEPDDPEIDASVALFEDLLAESASPEEAWQYTLWAMFQDNRMVTY